MSHEFSLSMRRDWLFLTSRQHSSDMMQVLPAVWMMMMMRFILGQWVSLASHADHEIIVEQKEKGSKKKKKRWICGLIVPTHVHY